MEATLSPLRDPCLRLALKLTGNLADAEDIANEALFKVWRRLARPNLPPIHPDRLLAYALRTVRNLRKDDLEVALSLREDGIEFVSLEEWDAPV